jgi:hypothetical protein
MYHRHKLLNINNICTKFKCPSTEVCINGFTGHLNLRRQMVNISSISAIAYLDINDNELVRSLSIFDAEIADMTRRYAQNESSDGAAALIR